MSVPSGGCAPHRRPDKRPKPGPAQPKSVLLPRIICCERRSLPALCTRLSLDGLPCGAQPPYQLIMVQQSGARPWWTPLQNKGSRRQLCIRVFIPVCAQIRDGCGALHYATSVVEADTHISPACPCSECWRYDLVIVPCIRLCHSPVCSEDCCFDVRLEAALELYLTRPEAFAVRACPPACPELPLYPPPVDCDPCREHPPRPCAPRCPEDLCPCGWPIQG